MKCAFNLDSGKHEACSGRDDKYTRYLVKCHLVENKGAMNELGALCSFCCLHIAEVITARDDLLITKKITNEELKRDDLAFVQFLSNVNKHYALLVPRLTGRKWSEIAFECKRCQGESVEVKNYSNVPATEANYVRASDF